MKLINKLIALLLACAFITGCTPKPSNNDVQPHVTASPEVSVAAVVETDAPPTDDSFILNEPTMPEFTRIRFIPSLFPSLTVRIISLKMSARCMFQRNTLRKLIITLRKTSILVSNCPNWMKFSRERAMYSRLATTEAPPFGNFKNMMIHTIG